MLRVFGCQGIWFFSSYLVVCDFVWLLFSCRLFGCAVNWVLVFVLGGCYRISLIISCRFGWVLATIFVLLFLMVVLCCFFTVFKLVRTLWWFGGASLAI